MTTKAAAIIPAAGSGKRMKSSSPKQYLDLAGKPVLVHTVGKFYNCSKIDHTVVVVPKEMVETTRKLLLSWDMEESLSVIEGGIRRQDSVKAGLDFLDASYHTVLVHDGARPLVSEEIILRCCAAVEQYDAAIAAIPVKDTLKKGGKENKISATVDRENLWHAQTPQAAKTSLLRQAFEIAGDRDVTDEASLFELAGIDVHLVEGSETNLKITRPEDLDIATRIIMQNTTPPRIGHGFDAHKLVDGRKLVLGGVHIDYHLGLDGHSDADVVTHALCDAILGALGKGDIGKHFPDTASEFKDIYSIKLLQQVVDTMQKDGYILANADITIVCQTPKLAPHITAMQETLANACSVDSQQINIKATTTEKMGYTGRSEGISTHAVVLLTL